MNIRGKSVAGKNLEPPARAWYSRYPIAFSIATSPLEGTGPMLAKLHSPEILADFYSVQSQLTMEMELKQFFVVTPANRIGDIFAGISGSVMNQFAYLNLVLKVIQELNIEPVQTFALLQAVRPIIYKKFDAATSRFIGKPVSGTTQSGTIVFEALELFTRLTDTYDSIINEARRFGDSQTFIIGSAIHMAMADKVKLIVCYLRLYHEVPQGIWKNANRLYVVSLECNVLSQVFQDKLAFPQHVLSIRQIYIYIMLLYSSGTRSLSTDEIFALAEFLKDWVKLANLKKLDPASSENVLCIDPMTMSVPVFSAELSDRNNPSLLVFDFEKLKGKLDKPFVTQKFVEGVRFTLSPWATQKILHNWIYHEKRLTTRTEVEKKAVLVRIGLISMASINFPKDNYLSDDFDSPDYSTKKLDFNLAPVLKNLTFLNSLMTEKPEPFKIKTVDYSNAGYCLEWPEKASAILSVNEILLVQDSPKGECKLGQIVWMKIKSNGVLRTGVSVIAQKVIPIYIRPIKSGGYGEAQEFFKGFIISSSLDGREYSGVLLKNKSLQTGKMVELIQNDKVIPAKLLEPFGHNDKYQLFNLAFFQA